MDINFLTNDEIVATNFPPVPASKMVPEWYKNLNRYMYPNEKIDAAFMWNNDNRIPQTVKACVPVQDYITSGYVLRASSDIIVTPSIHEGQRGFNWSSATGTCSSHTHEQCPVKINKEEHNYFKVKNDWVVKTPLGYSCYFYQPDFFLESGVRFFPGVVDTDVYDEPVNFVGYITTKETFTIKAGDPLMVVFPFKRENWQHKVEYTKSPFVSVSRRVFEKGYLFFFHKQKHYR